MEDIYAIGANFTVVSGGQTGADQAGLDWAIANGVQHGGWCPKGRKSEDGPIGDAYRLNETPSASYLQRTEWNVRDSDATLVFTLTEQLDGGSKRTVLFADALKKPWLHVREGVHPKYVARFLARHGVAVVNIAGKRESSAPGISRPGRGRPGARIAAGVAHDHFSNNSIITPHIRNPCMTSTLPFTINAIHVGSRLYEVLVHHATAFPGTPIRYGDLLAACRARNPDDAVVQRAVPIGIGMKLLFVQAFCDKYGYPNLACLAVNQSGKPGASYPGNWEQDMLAVASFDWSQAPAHLAVYVAEATARAKPVRKCKVTEDDARLVRWNHYNLDRSRYASFDDSDREEMINLLMECVEVEAAYQSIIDAKAELGAVS